MSGSIPMLSLMLAVPLVAAIACLFVDARTARWTALAATLINLALGVQLWLGFDIGGAQWQFVEREVLFGDSFQWALGIDGMALMLILLSVFLMPLCILASWEAISKRVPLYMAMFLIMEVVMIGVFCGAGFAAVLYLLRSRPDPDVFHHRHLGWSEPEICRVQILPLHAARLGADARRDDRDDPGGRNDGHSNAAEL
jgi:hypothetical protein